MTPSEQASPTASDLVVVGSSAGGIEALQVLLGNLPSDFPAPLVIAQHLDPHRPSGLAAILQRASPLPVEVVTTQTPLRPGRIYVVPSNHHVAIHDGHVDLEGDFAGRPRPSVDLLFSTAAEVYGEHLIAVILTGSGSDGTAGTIEVKNHGGTVVVQNPGTAKYAGMPSALPPTVVDIVVDLERIGPLLTDLLRDIAIVSSSMVRDDVLPTILDRVRQRSNIDFRPYKRTTILRRIGRRMAVTRRTTLAEYAAYLEQHPDEIEDLVKAFLINVTQFFRDEEAFAYLKEEILPRIIAEERQHYHALRFWSAGCSTGEEPYSLAMLVADLLGAELPAWSVKIFATDLDEAAIRFARRGVYSESLLQSVPEDYRSRFFERTNGDYRISKTLRQMVIFGEQDLSRSAPFPRIKLALCRNLLIYFTPELQDYVLNQLAFSLSPGGYLVLGKAETVRPSQAHFELVNKQWKVYRCTMNMMPTVGRPVPPELRMLRGPRPDRGQAAVLSRADHLSRGQAPANEELNQLRQFNELLLRFLPAGVVVVDSNYRLLTANMAAGRLLGLHNLHPEQDFLHAVRGIPYAQVRAAIDTVFRERNNVTLPEVELDTQTGGSGGYLSLSITLLQLNPGTPDLALISVGDVTEQVQTRERLETIQREQAELLKELGEANKRLNDMNKELQDANEELQVANEEMVLTHEELQATNEEFEATNEEFEATNEELETNNEELQATNEELQTTNDELRARSQELQEALELLETESGRLSEMVALAPFYILVLRGPNLQVTAYNPRYSRLMEGRDVQGRPLAEVAGQFWEGGAGLVDLAHEVYRTDRPRTSSRVLTYIPNDRHEPVAGYFVFTVVPSHDAGGQVDGVVLYAADVTEEQARRVEEERARLRLIFEHAEQIGLALYDAETAQLLVASPRYFTIIERDRSEQRPVQLGETWATANVFGELGTAGKVWDAVIEQREPSRMGEVRRKLAQDHGETIWDVSLTPISDLTHPDRIRYVLVTAIEMTEQVKAREEIERLDRLKDEFLSLASHELRTPLTPLMGYAGMLHSMVSQPETVPDKDQRERLVRLSETFNRQLGRLRVLVNDLVDVGRLESGKFRLERSRLALAAVVASAVDEARLIKPSQPIDLEIEEAAEALVVAGDRERLIQVILNLMQNAITYAAQSERLIVRLKCEQTDGTAWACIEVQDFGPGIPPEALPSLFTRFYQVDREDHRSRGGLGLGLYICKQIVEQHGGTIGVESTAGQGSTFIVRLPLATA